MTDTAINDADIGQLRADAASYDFHLIVHHGTPDSYVPKSAVGKAVQQACAAHNSDKIIPAPRCRKHKDTLCELRTAGPGSKPQNIGKDYYACPKRWSGGKDDEVCDRELVKQPRVIYVTTMTVCCHLKFCLQSEYV